MYLKIYTTVQKHFNRLTIYSGFHQWHLFDYQVALKTEKVHTMPGGLEPST